MQLIRGLSRWTDSTATVITIGNFDGVHRGHQSMLKTTQGKAEELGLPAVVVSFEPLPHEFFSSENHPPRLQGLRDRVARMRDAGIDRLLLLQFDQELATRSADDFIQSILVEKIQARHIVVGDDFRFGRRRQGNFQLLSDSAGRHGYSVEQSATCRHNGTRISSTAIRDYLCAGDLDAATALLGRAYRISGRVIHGEKVGRQLGYPTANVALGPHRPPLRGVFAVWATHLPTQERFAAVANLGERPTIGGRKLLLEVHALDTNVQWYGQHLAVDFVRQIRTEQRFDSLEELKVQIGRDATQAAAMLSSQR
ncbi:MAG: bifunctional riboflavin kinase/FAD synthetase [Granulosicoccus sp.]